MILLTDEEIEEIISPMLMVSPATIAKAQLKKVVEWGDEDCPEHAVEARESLRRGLELCGLSPIYPRRECQTCWQALKKECE